MIIVIKGQEFRYKIFFPESNGIPPDFTINMPTNQMFFSGTSKTSDKANWYETIVSLPLKAPSSTLDNAWSITWKYGTISKLVYFDVKDPDVSDDEIFQKELFKLAISNKDYLARMIIPERPEECEVKFYTNDLLLMTEDADIEDHRLGTQMKVEIPFNLMASGEHILIWTTDATEYYQTLNTIPIRYLPTIQKIRFTIDRIIKNITEPQAYLEADLAAALVGGLEYINGWSPITEWTLLSIPKGMMPFMVYAGAWYMLNSQFMLESDLAFSYSGQSVSLDYDRTGPIESEISRLQDFMTENLAKAKRAMLRGVTQGTLGVTTSGIGPTGMTINPRRRLIRIK